MLVSNMVRTIAVVLAVGACGCNRPAQETRDEAKSAESKVADSRADADRAREAEVAQLNDRVAQIEHDYAEKNAELSTGKKTATTGLREETQEDVANVKKAVANLMTTTADNWWDREEQAMRSTVDDIAADVKRLGGQAPEANQVATPTATTAPFTSRRDTFVTDMKGRVNALDRALEHTKARGPRETEVKDTRARINKVAADLDKLASASPDDWWKLSKERVSDYVERVEASVKRLDDNKGATR